MIVDMDVMAVLQRTAATFPARTADAFRALAADDPATTLAFGSGALVSWGPGRFVNRAIGVSLDELDDASLEGIETFFDEAGVPPSIEVCSSASPGLIAALASRLFAPVRFNDLLVTTGQVVDDGPGINPAVSVRPVDETSQADWHRAFVDGFATTPEERRLNDELAASLVHVRDAVHLLADLDGDVAGCGSLFHDGSVGWVGSAATLPQSRRRGVQAAMLDARIGIARELGCDLIAATATSGSASSRNLRRRGFRLAATILIMTRPPSRDEARSVEEGSGEPDPVAR